MEGTDIASYKDAQIKNDHTYFGNGCNQGWSGTSSIVCSSHIVKTWTGGTGDTYQGESQSIGVYYNYMATTVSSGNEQTTQTDIPDSFCPLGWQLPYGGTDGDYYDQSKSWYYLFNSTYRYKVGLNLGDGYKIMSYPFDYVPSGVISFAYAAPLEMHYEQKDGSANLYSRTNIPAQNASRLQIWHNTIIINGQFKSYGMTLRCVTRK